MLKWIILAVVILALVALVLANIRVEIGRAHV